MGALPCPFTNEQCKYYDNANTGHFDTEAFQTDNGCFSDTHHIYWRETYENDLDALYGNLPENLTQMCRSDHDELHANMEAPELPSREEKLGRVILALLNNELNLHFSVRKQKKLFGQKVNESDLRSMLDE